MRVLDFLYWKDCEMAIVKRNVKRMPERKDVIMRCPYCMNEIKEIEECPECGTALTFMSGEGPMGTWECRICSTEEMKVGYRPFLFGLVRVKDLVGRYAPKKKDESEEV